jgi:hypothetical protein
VVLGARNDLNTSSAPLLPTAWRKNREGQNGLRPEETQSPTTKSICIIPILPRKRIIHHNGTENHQNGIKNHRNELGNSFIGRSSRSQTNSPIPLQLRLKSSCSRRYVLWCLHFPPEKLSQLRTKHRFTPNSPESGLPPRSSLNMSTGILGMLPGTVKDAFKVGTQAYTLHRVTTLLRE